MDSRSLLIFTLVVLLAASVGTSVYFYINNTQTERLSIPVPDLSQVTPKPESYKGEPILVEIDLFFLTPDHTMLTTEKRQIEQPPTLNERVQVAVEELLDGPLPSRDLLNPIPADTQLQTVFWEESTGRVYLSFTPELLQKKPTHALGEWALLYSIVNTVAAQSPVIKEVQILVDGQVVQSSETIWDWSLPFQQDTTFVKFAPEESGA